MQAGGCYGLCELGPNVVVRRRPRGESVKAEFSDRLSLTGGPEETVYCGVRVDDVDGILAAHLEHDAPLTPLTRAVREREQAPRTLVEDRIRRLRAARAQAEPRDRQPPDDDTTEGTS